MDVMMTTTNASMTTTMPTSSIDRSTTTTSSSSSVDATTDATGTIVGTATTTTTSTTTTNNNNNNVHNDVPSNTKQQRRMMKLLELKQRLLEVKTVEEKLASSKWNNPHNQQHQQRRQNNDDFDDNNGSSPRSSLDDVVDIDFQSTFLNRYQQAKALYMQRRLDSLVVDRLATFDPETNEFDIQDIEDAVIKRDDNGRNSKMVEGGEEEKTIMETTTNNDKNGNNTNDDDDDDDASSPSATAVAASLLLLEDRNAATLSTLETTVQSLHAKLQQLRDTYHSVRTRREELEHMIQDLEEEEEQDDDDDDDDCCTDDDDDSTVVMDDDKMDDNDETVMALEQQTIESLQQKKRQLQDELDQVRKEKEMKERTLSAYRTEVSILQEERSKIVQSGQDLSQFDAKIQQLKDMKEFYDSLRAVLEELGGVKVLNVREDTVTRHVHLTLLLYEEYKISVELEVYLNDSLKLVDAKWIDTPIVTSIGTPPNSLDDDDDDDKSSSNEDPKLLQLQQSEDLSLEADPLDDLVRVARGSLGPPHDMRFVIREACARVRILQGRVDDLNMLRQRVLTKVVGNDQVYCSINEGIVIVMRLYDHWVKVEQIVGVNGWDGSLLERIRSSIPDKDQSLKPDQIVAIVQNELDRLQRDGVELPKTPIIPKRQHHEDTK